MRSLRFVFALSLVWPTLSLSHGPRPQVIGLSVSQLPGGGIHALTDNQGVFADLNFSYKWVCEDAIYPFARTQGLALLGPDETRWLVATNHGLHVSVDGGCDFEAVDHPIGSMRLSGLWENPVTEGVVTATASPDSPSNLFASTDEGRTWNQLLLQVNGVVKDIHWVVTEPLRMLVHSEMGLYLAEANGVGFQPMEIRTPEQVVPLEFVSSVVVSPVDPERIVVLANAGERTRIILSTDMGRSWTDVALLDEADVSGVFDATGEKIMGVGLLGGRWQSRDAGDTWQVEPLGAPTIRCLLRGRGTTVYACANPNDGGPWVIGRTRDFGQTWTSILGRFEETTHRKDCPSAARTVQCCRGRCPGDETMCGQPTDPDWPPECYETQSVILDQGLLDEGVTFSVDAGVPFDFTTRSDIGLSGGADATNTRDVHVPDRDSTAAMMTSKQDGGCTAMPRHDGPIDDQWFYLAISLGCIRLVLHHRRIHFGQPS